MFAPAHDAKQANHHQTRTGRKEQRKKPQHSLEIGSFSSKKKRGKAAHQPRSALSALHRIPCEQTRSASWSRTCSRPPDAPACAKARQKLSQQFQTHNSRTTSAKVNEGQKLN